jgi:hypothetical protein
VFLTPVSTLEKDNLGVVRVGSDFGPPDEK